MKGTRPASDTALPAKRRRAPKSDSLALAGAIIASAAPDPSTIDDRDGARKILGDAIEHLTGTLRAMEEVREPVTIAEAAGTDFPAALTLADVEQVAKLYKEYGTYVRFAFVVLAKDAAACHETAAQMKAAGETQILLDARASIEATAGWLRQTADLMDKAALRMLAGMARCAVERDGSGTNEEGDPAVDAPPSAAA